MGGEDHRCEWRDKAEKLEAEVRDLRSELASIHGTLEKIQRQVFGKRSEKMPSVATAIRDPDRAEAERIAALQTRRENAEKKRQLVTRRIEQRCRTSRRSARSAAGTTSRSSATAR
jgi:transposase